MISTALEQWGSREGFEHAATRDDAKEKIYYVFIFCNCKTYTVVIIERMKGKTKTE